MERKTFDYPRWQHFTRTIIVAYVLLLSAIMAIVLLFSLASGVETSGHDFGLAQLVEVLISFVGISLLIIGSLAVYMMFPAIHVRADEFKISTLLYQSNWMSWEEIMMVKELWLSYRKQLLLAVVVKDISLLYAVIGLTQFLGGQRAFLIHKSLNNHQDLMTLFHEKRPDLFEGEG
jgi:hypothetical protein